MSRILRSLLKGAARIMAFGPLPEDVARRERRRQHLLADMDEAVAAEYLRRIGADRPLAERAARARELTKDAPVIRRRDTPNLK